MMRASSLGTPSRAEPSKDKTQGLSKPEPPQDYFLRLTVKR
jgi:hypothetical protein